MPRAFSHLSAVASPLSSQKRRVGRGIGSSKGKTSGRGHKGQKARSGGSIPLSFEGGQTRFFKLLPKRGFTNHRHKTDMVPVNLGTIQDHVDMGRLLLPAGGCWTMKDLLDAGICTASSVKHGIKLLAKGGERLTAPIRIEISRASEEAIRAVEAVGGEVTTVHYNKLALRALLKPEKFVKPTAVAGGRSGDGGSQQQEGGEARAAAGRLPKFARPPPKWQPYYTNWERHRGYLSVQAQMRKLLKKRPELEDAFARALEERDQTM